MLRPHQISDVAKTRSLGKTSRAYVDRTPEKSIAIVNSSGRIKSTWIGRQAQPKAMGVLQGIRLHSFNTKEKPRKQTQTRTETLICSRKQEETKFRASQEHSRCSTQVVCNDEKKWGEGALVLRACIALQQHLAAIGQRTESRQILALSSRE